MRQKLQLLASGVIPESGCWYCQSWANISGTPIHTALTPSPVLFAPPKRRFPQLALGPGGFRGAKHHRAPAGASDFPSVKARSRAGRVPSSSKTLHIECLGAKGLQQDSPFPRPPSSALARPGCAASDPALATRRIPGRGRGRSGPGAGLRLSGLPPAGRRQRRSHGGAAGPPGPTRGGLGGWGCGGVRARAL